jgi:carboxypeptidase family protein
MPRPIFLALLLGVLVRASAAQPTRVQAPSGTLTGTVQDSATGLPVGFALVVLVEHGQRVFASEGGRFTLSGLASGPATLRILQIGYRAVSLSLSLDASPGSATGAPGVTVRLARVVFLLPEIVVEGDVCTGVRQRSGAVTDGILGEIFKNAERLLTLQEVYPFQETYQETTAFFDSLGTVTGGRIDTGRYDSRRILRYRRGRVIEREGPARVESARYFQPSDLAREEFRRTHCFWYAGMDTLDGYRALRIQFAPLKEVKTTDWAGSLLIDSATMVLERSEAHLVSLPSRGTFVSATCTLLYQQVYPTLVTLQQGRCVSRIRAKPPRTTVARWRLIDFKFLKRAPSDSGPPNPDPPLLSPLLSHLGRTSR